MAADPLQVRIARLEGGYEQIDKRMSSLESVLRDLRDEFEALRREVREEIHRQIQRVMERIDRLDGRIDRLDGRMDRLDGRIDHLDGRVDLILYGLVVAILVPIFLRVFFR